MQTLMAWTNACVVTCGGRLGCGFMGFMGLGRRPATSTEESSQLAACRRSRSRERSCEDGSVQ